MNKRVFFILAVLLRSLVVLAQETPGITTYSTMNDMKFADYLSLQGEFKRAVAEYERCLFFNNSDIGSINYKIAVCLYRDGQYAKSLAKFETLAISDSASSLFLNSILHMACINFNLEKYALSNRILSRLERCTSIPPQQFELGRLLHAGNELGLRQYEIARKSLALISNSGGYALSKNKLLEYSYQGEKLGHKNVQIAAVLSTLVPGAGKMYIGRKIDGLFSLVLIAIASWQSYDGFSHDGIKSTKGWIFTGIGSVYYLGNIYGSAVAAKIYNQEINNAFHRQISVELCTAIEH